jgi:hypothetical protein
MRSALQALVPPEQQRHLERLTSGAQAVANLLRSQHIHPQATPTPPPTTTRQQRKPLRLGTLDDFRTKFNKYYELNRGASPRSEAVTSSAPDVPESAHAESEAFEAEHADTEYAETEYAETEYAESEASDDSDDDSFGGCAGGGTGGGISSGARPQFVRPSAQRPSYGGVPFPSTSTHHDTSSGLAAGRAEAIREERRRERWDSGGSGFNQEEFLRESRMKSDYDRDARLSELRMQNMMASSMRHDDYLYDLRMDELRRG